MCGKFAHAPGEYSSAPGQITPVPLSLQYSAFIRGVRQKAPGEHIHEKERKKAILTYSILLALLLTLIPGTALATDPCASHTFPTDGSTYTCSTCGTEWKPVTASIIMLSNGYYYLPGNISQQIQVENNNTATLDLNGHTCTGGLQINVKGTLTLLDSGTSGTIDNSAKTGQTVTSNATLYANGGTIKGNVTNAGKIANTTTSVTRFTGTVSNVTTNGVISGGVFDGTVTNLNAQITGGTFSGTVINLGTISGGVFDGTVTNQNAQITGGTFSGIVTNYMSNISGGTFTSTSTVANNGNITNGTFSGTVNNRCNITGGTFTITSTVTNYGSISGGEFKTPVTGSGTIGGTATTPTPESSSEPETTPTHEKTSSGISLWYEGGNTFGSSRSAVPTAVEIDGAAVSFIGTGSRFTVSSLPTGARWITVRWNSITVTTNFTPDANAYTAQVAIPKTGGISLAALAVLAAAAAGIVMKKK